MASVLVIDDEIVLTRQIARALSVAGHGVRVADTGSAGLEAIRDDPPDLLLLDLRLPDGSGLDVLRELRSFDEGLPVVVITAFGSVPDAVEAMRIGAEDYLQKPLDLAELGLLVERLLTRQKRARELAYLRERDRLLPTSVVGQDPRLVAIFDQVRRLREANISPGDRPTILLSGETGTGKGVVARAIHELLGGGPYIDLNCTTVPPTLVEGELFGHERGSFTDARTARPGLFEAADGGTVFLDEIGELDLAVQAKFLQAVEEKRVRRLGARREREVNVHVIVASHRDLEVAVQEGRFREDLLHRLRVLTFEIPPLRERSDDIPALVQHFCDSFGRKYGGRPRRVTPACLDRLTAHTWPGNVRELRNAIERTILLNPEEELGPDAFGELFGELADEAGDAFMRLPGAGIDLEALERELLTQALARAEGNRTRAAALLGLSRDTLRYRIEKWGIE